MKTGTRRIPLSQGKFAIVDSVDYEWLIQWKWYAAKNGRTYYARRGVRCRPRKELKKFLMHREIAKRSGYPDSKCYDHKDRNGLNNSRENIRPCNDTQNRFNANKCAGKTSRFKGVYWHKQNKRWCALIQVKGRRIFLGCFIREREAAQAYRIAAVRYAREFAFTPGLSTFK